LCSAELIGSVRQIPSLCYGTKATEHFDLDAHDFMIPEIYFNDLSLTDMGRIVHIGKTRQKRMG